MTLSLKLVKGSCCNKPEGLVELPPEGLVGQCEFQMDSSDPFHTFGLLACLTWGPLSLKNHELSCTKLDNGAQIGDWKGLVLSCSFWLVAAICNHSPIQMEWQSMRC